MNDLTHGTASIPTAPTPPASIIPGSVWQHQQHSPWPAGEGVVRCKIIDAKDGWVRYYLCESAPDQREPEEEFRRRYEPTHLYATGELLKAPVPRDELEAALADMLSAFHFHEVSFAARDAAIRRALLAIGAKVTL